MSANRVRAAYVELQRLVARERPAAPGDGQLLDRYVRQRDEQAFATLVDRHGPMVMGVCRRVLRQTQDAEDAFQATFIVLARKASSIRKLDSTGSWLYGVAYRTAIKARSVALRRVRHESNVLRALVNSNSCSAPADDLRGLLDTELQALPERLRQPLVLAYFEGKTKEEVASELGWPTGTVSSRLARGRAMLRERLMTRGITLAMAGLVASLEAEARANVPIALARQVMTSISCGCTAPTRTVDLLVKGVLLSMLWNKFKFALGTGVVAVGLTWGTGYGLFQSAGGQSFPNSSDAATDRVAQLIRLKNVSATDVQTTLEKLFKTADKDKAGQQPTFVAETGTNSILFSATRQQKQDIEKVIAAMDDDGKGHNKNVDFREGKAQLVDWAKLKQDDARLEVKLRRAEFEAGKGTVESLCAACKRLEESVRDVGMSKEAVLSAAQFYQTNMKEIAEIAKERYKAGKMSEADRTTISYHVLDAEMMMLRATASVVQPAKNADPVKPASNLSR